MRTNDPNFDFVTAKNEDDANRATERMIRQQIDERRRVVRGLNPHGETKPQWEVDADPANQQPMWTTKTDKNGRITEIRQNRPTQSDLATKRFLGKRFIVRIDEQTSVGGHLATPGALIDCYGDSAFTLHGLRGSIIKEYSAE